MNTSKFEEFYKNKGKSDIKQSERRKLLLIEQKRLRNESLDKNRDILQFQNKTTFINRKNKKQKKFNVNFQDKLQMSEWLIEKPDDIENWYCVPCPKGKRCLLVSYGGITECYNKSGYLFKTFRSNLPGDQIHHNEITILDSFYIHKTKTFYLLDIISYGNIDLINCDTAFRFYWLKSKALELHLNEITPKNEYQMLLLQFYDFNDMDTIKLSLTKYPMWSDNSPILDGMLFFHKESSYVHGRTPLVGWLFTYMIPEIFGININNNYLLEKPFNYIDYKSYINYFDNEIINRKNKHKQLINIEMENDDECNSSNIELSGMDTEELNVDN